MFSAEPHIALFAEAESLAERQQVPDPTLIIASLESKNALDSVGGKHYITRLASKDYKEENFPEYCKIVVDSFKGRSLLSMASGIKKEALNSETIDDVIGKMRRGLDDLVEMRGGNGVLHLSDLTAKTFDEIVARTKNPGIRGISWGVPSLDKVTGGKSAGDLVIIGGRPGAGKTSVICNSILADAYQGKPSLLIEREMRPSELLERLVCIETGIPSTNLRLGALDQGQIDALYASMNKLKKLPIYLDANFRTNDPYYIESTVNKFRNKHGIEVVYLDYIQILTERDEGQTQEIGRFTRLFKMMANDLNICNVVCSQLNRQVESRDDKRPMLSDLRQSGSIEEDADFVIGLYRDEYYNKDTKFKNMMEYIILKHRNGPTGTVTVKFDGPTYKISEL
jgi:replicative DNA helicase